MVIGCTADLHYGMSPRLDRCIERFIEQQVAPAGLELLLVAGDVAEAAGLPYDRVGAHHERILRLLRDAAGCPLAFCAGNHDIWTTDPWLDSSTIYQEVLPDVAARVGATYLDVDNLVLDDLAVAGCYGHFDYSLKVPDLVMGGRLVTEDDYREQVPPGVTEPVWMDKLRIHWEWDDPQACRHICSSCEQRVRNAVAGRGHLVLVSHTVPRAEVNGHTGSDRPVSLFLNAFSGTRRLEQILRSAATSGARLLSVSGHTHAHVPLTSIAGVDYVNVGGNYGKPRLEVLRWPA